jgi:Ser/Thr protein kinase RdoA (MazF antagonist)
VYDLELDDRSHIIVKFYRPGRWTEAQILEEHEFISDLAGDEIPVCAPMKFTDGSSLRWTGEWFFAVWPRTGGRAADEFSIDQLGQLGRLLGRIHQAGRKKKTRQRLRFESSELVRKPLEEMILSGRIPAEILKRYRESALWIADLYDEKSDGLPLQRIHGDCHPGNLLYGDRGFFILDFDDFYEGPAIQDLWMLTDRENMAPLLDHYRMFSDFDDRWLDLIEVLRGMRYVYYAGWISRRWEDPAFRSLFPQFGTPDYWLEQTADLEVQLELIRKPSGIVPAGKNPGILTEEEAELTNKDFFWDLE